jgi:hypothetical protein
MTVIHFIKVSVLYPRVVISSLAKRLENLLFIIIILHLVYDLEITTCCFKVTMGHMPDLAKLVRGNIAMLRFFGVVRGTTSPLAPCGSERMTLSLLTHSSKAHFTQHL